jgi:hypothetical protein
VATGEPTLGFSKVAARAACSSSHPLGSHAAILCDAGAHRAFVLAPTLNDLLTTTNALCFIRSPLPVHDVGSNHPIFLPRRQGVSLLLQALLTLRLN